MGDARREQPLAPSNMLRRASGLSAAGVVGSALAIPTALLGARWLGAQGYGRAQWVLLVYAYAALVRTGAFEAGMRTFVHHSATGDEASALRAQNVGVSVDTAASIGPGIVAAACALLVADPLRQLGLAVAPVAAVSASVSSYFAAMYSARLQFGVVARVALVRAIVLPTLTLLGISAVGPAAIFIAPVLTDGVALLQFLWVGRQAAHNYRKEGELHLRPIFTRVEAGHLIKAGFPLGAQAIVYWAYRLVGSTTVAAGFSTATFGLYSFAIAPVDVLARLVSNLQGVMMPSLWTEMSIDQQRRTWVGPAQNLTVFLALVGGFICNAAQAGFGPLVVLVAHPFVPAIPIFEVSALNIPLLCIATVPSLVMTSHAVNRQGAVLGVFVSAVGLNVLANTLALVAGFDVIAVACNDLWVQMVVVVVLFEFAAPHQGPTWARTRTYGILLLALSLTAAVGVALHFNDPLNGSVATMASITAIRVLVVTCCWAVMGFGLMQRKAWSFR